MGGWGARGKRERAKWRVGIGSLSLPSPPLPLLRLHQRGGGGVEEERERKGKRERRKPGKEEEEAATHFCQHFATLLGRGSLLSRAASRPGSALPRSGAPSRRTAQSRGKRFRDPARKNRGRLFRGCQERRRRRGSALSLSPPPRGTPSRLTSRTPGDLGQTCQRAAGRGGSLPVGQQEEEEVGERASERTESALSGWSRSSP